MTTPPSGQEPGEPGQPAVPPPYGTPPGYGVPPPGYGAPPPYGYPQPAYGYPGRPDLAAGSVRTQAIVALVVGIVLGLACCIPGGIASAVTAWLAMGRVDRDLASARRLLRWSWGITAASVVLGVVVIVLFVVYASDPGFPPQN